MAQEVFEILKHKKLEREGCFFRKEGQSHKLFKVGDEAALDKITRDFRERNTRISKWSQAEEEAVEPTLRYYPKRGDEPEALALAGQERGAKTVFLKKVDGVTLSYYDDQYRVRIFPFGRPVHSFSSLLCAGNIVSPLQGNWQETCVRKQTQ